MKNKLNIDFERGVRFLVEHLPISDEKSRKPLLFHSIRVGTYLYENKYSDDIILAGLLHDTIEWSKINKELLRKEFGDNIAKLVLANTKDDNIKNSDDKINELIKRSVQGGQSALIIKTADIIDSFKYYSNQKNEKEIQYCIKNAIAILKLKPKEFDDKIFVELRKWL